MDATAAILIGIGVIIGSVMAFGKVAKEFSQTNTGQWCLDFLYIRFTSRTYNNQKNTSLLYCQWILIG